MTGGGKGPSGRSPLGAIEEVLFLPLDEARGVGEGPGVRWIIRTYERVEVEAHGSWMGGARAA